MNWKAATNFFLLGYAIASAIGFALYLFSPIAMWIGMFTLMPALFAYLAYIYYLKYVRSTSALVSIVQLAGYWVLLSFVLDGAVYILLLPVVFGAPPNWLFFIDQSPWIWFAYTSLVFTVVIGFYVSRAAMRKGIAAQG